MATSVKQMLEAANAAVPRITPTQARDMMAKGNALVVDVRAGPEVAPSGNGASRGIGIFVAAIAAIVVLGGVIVVVVARRPIAGS